jgi:hypothetical protein
MIFPCEKTCNESEFYNFEFLFVLITILPASLHKSLTVSDETASRMVTSLLNGGENGGVSSRTVTSTNLNRVDCCGGMINKIFAAFECFLLTF